MELQPYLAQLTMCVGHPENAPATVSSRGFPVKASAGRNFFAVLPVHFPANLLAAFRTGFPLF